MKRDRATELLDGMLIRVVGGEGWPLELVDSVSVFGSYARGALEPGDVDVAVDLNRQSARWQNHFINCLSYGRDPYSVVRQALRGRKRGVSVLFEREGHDDVPMVPIWRRGETIDVALDRVRAILADPSAGRAPRHAMLPCFEGLEEWLPRFIREELCDLIDLSIVNVDQVKLVEAEVKDPWIRSEIARRWGVQSPLRRAAHAALAELQSREVDPIRRSPPWAGHRRARNAIFCWFAATVLEERSLLFPEPRWSRMARSRSSDSAWTASGVAPSAG